METTDAFQFANQIDEVKNDLNIELFLFNKNFTPYSVRYNETALTHNIRALFLYDIINTINLGAGTGLSVHDLELSQELSTNENVLLRTDLSNVRHADNLIHIIENERSDMIEFSESEHEFKRMKGIIARFTHEDKKFYIFKKIEQSKVLRGSLAWQLNQGQFSTMNDEVAVQISADNQVLVTGNDIFIFNQSKFEKMFNYDIVRILAADKKVIEFEKQYKVSVPNGFDGIHNYLRESDALLEKFLQTQIGTLTQEQIIETADEMALELMTGDGGEIILTDKSDLHVMLDIMNDNYYQSHATGIHYVAKSKKIIE